jgi:hypothetical protein
MEPPLWPKLILFALIATSVAVPMLFRGSMAVRVFSVAALILMAALHLIFLIGLNRLVLSQYRPLKHPNPFGVPDDYVAAADVAHEFSRSQSVLYLALIAAFALLAVIPVKQKTSPPTH